MDFRIFSRERRLYPHWTLSLLTPRVPRSSTLTIVQDLDLIADEELQVILKGVPEGVSTWLICKGCLDKSH